MRAFEEYAFLRLNLAFAILRQYGAGNDPDKMRETAELVSPLLQVEHPMLAQQAAFAAEGVGKQLAEMGEGFDLWQAAVDRLGELAYRQPLQVPDPARSNYHSARASLISSNAAALARWTPQVIESPEQAWNQQAEAMVHQREAVRFATPALRASAVYMLAQGLTWPAESLCDHDMVEEAVTVSREAVVLAERDHPEVLAWSLITLGLALKHRFTVADPGSPDDLWEAVAVLRRVERVAEPSDAESRASALEQLGDVYFLLSDRPSWVAAYQAGLRLPGVSAMRRIRLANRYGACAAQSAVSTEGTPAWRECAEQAAWAYELAVDVARNWSRSGLSRLQRELPLTEIGMVGSSSCEAARWLTLLGREAHAAVLLDGSRGMLLSRRAHDEAVHVDLARRGRHDLVDRLRRLDAELVDISDMGDAPDLARRSSALRQEICEVIGHDPIQAELEYHDLVTAAEAMPIVYLFPGLTMGFALIVLADAAEPQVVRLPQLTTENVEFLPFDLQLAAEALRRGETSSAGVCLRSLLDAMGEWALRPVSNALAGHRKAALMPCGSLAQLPLHAAADPGEMVAEPVFNYVTNARALARGSAAIQSTGKSHRVLAVGDDGSGCANLPRLRSVQMQLGLIPAELRGERLVYEEGNDEGGGFSAKVAVAMPRHDVFHFVCHGVADGHDPLNSRLILGSGAISVRDVLRMRLPGTRLAILIACESGTAHPTLPDEQRGLPVGLFEAGLAGVIATMWRVEEIPASLLTARFYEEWQALDDPGLALAAARAWLRTLTRAEIRARYSALDRRRSRLTGGATSVPDDDSCPYGDPLHWAAYVYHGV